MLFAQRRKRRRIEAVGRAHFVEGVELVVERIDGDAGLRARRTAAQIGEHAAGPPHRPGGEAKGVGLLLLDELRRAHEGVLITHLAAGERQPLHQAVAVKQMRLAQGAALEQARPVAIERAVEVARDLAIDQRRLIAPAAFGNSEQRQTAWRRIGNVVSFHRHCHG